MTSALDYPLSNYISNVIAAFGKIETEQLLQLLESKEVTDVIVETTSSILSHACAKFSLRNLVWYVIFKSYIERTRYVQNDGNDKQEKGI